MDVGAMKLRWLRSGSASYSSVVDKRILLLMLCTASVGPSHRHTDSGRHLSEFQRIFVVIMHTVTRLFGTVNVAVYYVTDFKRLSRQYSYS